ncbi:hypothetical protein GQ457_06G000690 [Hibiscus cannabinus]
MKRSKKKDFVLYVKVRFDSQACSHKKNWFMLTGVHSEKFSTVIHHGGFIVRRPRDHYVHLYLEEVVGFSETKMDEPVLGEVEMDEPGLCEPEMDEPEMDEPELGEP